MEYERFEGDIAIKKFIREITQTMHDKNYKPEPGKKSIHLTHPKYGPGHGGPGTSSGSFGQRP